MQREDSWLKNKITYKILALAGLLLIPVLICLVPLSWVESQHSVCLIRNITGHDCYGCGMTRAVSAVMHFRLSDAFHFNKLVIIVFPLLVYIWGEKIYTLQKIIRRSKHLTINNINK
jgi:hypothetical protein